MADHLSPEQRSLLMSKISGKNTKPEILVRKFLFANGFRYRKNVKSLPGSPDIVLPKYKTVVFIHGCFWHGHTNCKFANIPSSNIPYWQKKRETNLKRDVKKILELENSNWRVLIVWGCELKNVERRNERMRKLVEEIKQIS